MKPIEFNNLRNRMQSSGIAPCRNAIARIIFVTSLLIISVLASLPEVSRAQLPCNANCHYLTLNESDLTNINCVGCQTVEACEGGKHCTHAISFSISLNASATCCIDSIGVTPDSGVCWKGCMATTPDMGMTYNLWQLDEGASPSCTSLPCNILGAPYYQLCNGYTIYGNFCVSPGQRFQVLSLHFIGTMVQHVP